MIKMTKMKRFLAATVAVVMLIAMTGCSLGKKLTAYGLYSKFAKDIKNAGGMEADVAAKVSFNIMGMDMSVDIPMNLKMVGKDSQVSVEILEAETVTTILGDMTYIESGDLKIKYKTPTDTEEGEKPAIDISSMSELSKEIFEGVEIIKYDDGTAEIIVDIPMSEAMGLMGGVAQEADIGNMNFGDANAVFRFNKENSMTHMIVSCDFSVEESGVSLSGTMEIDYEFINLGTTPEIKLAYPESEYTEVGADEADSLV